jgi:peroxiredoxin
MMSNWRTMTDSIFCAPHRRLKAVAALFASLGLACGAWAASPTLIGHAAPDFALPAVAGSNVRLSEYRGQPVIVSFWSSNCSGCTLQLEALNRLYGTYRSSGLMVLAVSVDDNPVHALQYARARGTSYPLLLDSAKNVGRAFAIGILPSAVLIDRSGVVRYVHADDAADERPYVAQIRTLLDDKPAVP